MRTLLLRLAFLLGIGLFLTGLANAQTKIFIHTATSDVNGYKEMHPVQQGPAKTTSVTNTAASGTDIQATATAGGSTVAWISPPLKAGFTLSGTVTCNVWGGESATSANSAFRCRLFKYSGGAEGASILTAAMTTELSTTVATARNWTGTPSSTVFATGDRIVFKLFLENCATSGCPTGTMGGSQTVTADYDGTTTAADGDAWVQITESVNFAPSVAPAAESLSESDSATGIRGVAGNPATTLQPDLTTTDSVIRIPGKLLTETLSESDSVAKLVGRLVGVSTSLTTTDSVAEAAHITDNPAAQSLTTTATVSPNNGRVLSETLTTAGSVGINVTRSASASLTTSDSAAEVASYGRSLNPESLTTSPSVGIIVSRSVVATLSESDAAAIGPGFSPSVSLSESDSAAKNVGLHVAPGAQTLTESDSAVTGGGTLRSAVVNLSESDSAAYRTTFGKSVSESLTTSVSAATGKILTEGLAESNTTTAIATASINSGGANAVFPTTKLQPALTTSDSVLTVKGLHQTESLPETLVTSAQACVIATVHGLTETLVTADSVARSGSGPLLAAVTESLSNSSSAAEHSVLSQAPVQTLVTTASASEQFVTNRAASASLTTSDTLARGLNGSGPITQNLATTDVVSASTTAQRFAAVSAILSTLDAVQGLAKINPRLTESFTEADSVAQVHTPNQARTVTEVLSTVDNPSITAFLRNIFVQNSSTVIDGVSRSAGSHNTVSPVEVLPTVTMAVSNVKTLTVRPSEALTTAGVPTRSWHTNLSFFEGLTTSSAVSATVNTRNSRRRGQVISMKVRSKTHLGRAA